MSQQRSTDDFIYGTKKHIYDEDRSDYRYEHRYEHRYERFLKLKTINKIYSGQYSRIIRIISNYSINIISPMI